MKEHRGGRRKEARCRIEIEEMKSRNEARRTNAVNVNCLWKSPACFKFVMMSRRWSPVGKHTYQGKRCVAIVLQVEMTMVQTVERPMPNNTDRVQYSMFVANLQIVGASHACTLMRCLIVVSCLSIRVWSSLHNIMKLRHT